MRQCPAVVRGTCRQASEAETILPGIDRPTADRSRLLGTKQVGRRAETALSAGWPRGRLGVEELVRGVDKMAALGNDWRCNADCRVHHPCGSGPVAVPDMDKADHLAIKLGQAASRTRFDQRLRIAPNSNFLSLISTTIPYAGTKFCWACSRQSDEFALHQGPVFADGQVLACCRSPVDAVFFGLTGAEGQLFHACPAK